MNKKISAFILAGGQSKRFGQDKSLYEFEGKPLIKHVFDTIKPVFSDIYIIANDFEKFSFLESKIYPDLIPKLGPTGGIYSALYNLKKERAFIFACDTPFVKKELIEYMISINTDKEIIVPFLGGFLEPLHAIYSEKCLESMKNFIEKKGRKITAYINEREIREVTEAEIEYYEDPFKIFRNINRKSDL